MSHFVFYFSFCTVGTRIVKSVQNCSKDHGTDLYLQFCHLKPELQEELGPLNSSQLAERAPWVYCWPTYLPFKDKYSTFAILLKKFARHCEAAKPVPRFSEHDFDAEAAEKSEEASVQHNVAKINFLSIYWIWKLKKKMLKSMDLSLDFNFCKFFIKILFFEQTFDFWSSVCDCCGLSQCHLETFQKGSRRDRFFDAFWR